MDARYSIKIPKHRAFPRNKLDYLRSIKRIQTSYYPLQIELPCETELCTREQRANGWIFTSYTGINTHSLYRMDVPNRMAKTFNQDYARYEHCLGKGDAESYTTLFAHNPNVKLK